MSDSEKSVIHFGVFDADLATGELRRKGRLVKLQPKPFELLALLLERQGELVTREEIRQKIWRGDDSFDFEHSLNFAITKIRESLNDDAGRPRYIETLPRRGYRFIAPAERIENGPAPRKTSQRPIPENGAAPIAEGPKAPQEMVHTAVPHVSDSATSSPAAVPGFSEEAPESGKGRTDRRQERVLSGAKGVHTTARSRWALAAVVALSVVLVTLWVFVGRRDGQPNEPIRIAPFTGLAGLESQPAFSPDGKQLAYVWDDGKGTTARAIPHPLGHIYVKFIGAGAPLQLTHDTPFDQGPAWSPDGRYIVFIRNWTNEEGMAQVISVPALGGPEHRLAEIDGEQPSRGVTWSPDGKFVVTNSAPDYGLFLISAETGEKRRVTSPPRGQALVWDTDSAFSPDGRTLAFIRRTGAYVSDIYLQNVDTAEAKARRLTFDRAMIWGLAWTPDGRDIVFSSKRAGFATLWKIPVSGGEIEPVAGVGGNAFFPTMSPKDHLLAYANQKLNVDIWRVQVATSGRAEGSPKRIISGSGLQADGDISPDGKRIAFASDRSGDREIWLADADGSNQLQLTSLHAPLTGSPHWSPDGRWIAFDSHVSEHGGVFVVSAQGGTPRRLTPPGIEAAVPTWSRDGSSIYFSGNPGENGGIWKISVQGGDAVRVADGFGCRESDDGKWLYSGKYLESDKTAILRTPVGGGRESVVFDGVKQRLWTVAGQSLYYLDVDAKLHATLNSLNLATRKNSRIADVQKEPFVPLWGGLSVSPDGLWIIYPQLDGQISNIMLVENFHW